MAKMSLNTLTVSYNNNPLDVGSKEVTMKKTYHQFINGLPSNAKIKIKDINQVGDQLLSPSMFLDQFEAMTRLDAKTEYMVRCEFTIVFS